MNYFFIGGPAYKKPIASKAKFWELPICIIVDYKRVTPKRIFPFDTGAFAKQIFPGYAGTLEMKEFELDADFAAASRLIGAYFATAKDYFYMRPVSEADFLEKYDPDPLEAEVHALYALANREAQTLDERSFCLEVQTTEPLALSDGAVKCVIAPLPYLDSELFVSTVKGVWNSELLTYDVYPIDSNAYQLAVYDLVKECLTESGHI